MMSAGSQYLKLLPSAVRLGGAVPSGHWINSESDPLPDPMLSTMPEEHADNRFSFFLDGGVPKAANRRTQTFDRLVPNPERFREGMFQEFSPASNVFWAGGGIARFPALGKNQAEFLQYIPSAQSALL